MLASRVAHASAKGRSRESGYRIIVWVYPKAATKTFRAPSRLSRHYLIRSRPASTTYENAKLCTWATFWGSPSLPTTKGRAVGSFGRTASLPRQLDVRRSKIGKMFPLGERGMQSDLGARPAMSECWESAGYINGMGNPPIFLPGADCFAIISIS